MNWHDFAFDTIIAAALLHAFDSWHPFDMRWHPTNFYTSRFLSSG
jgi:hypothetical protein